MSQRPVFKLFALANFGVGLGFFCWLACAPPKPPPRSEPAASPATPEPEPGPSAPPSLANRGALIACLKGGGGVVDRACITPAKVDGVEPIEANDRYFHASKSAPVLAPGDPVRVVDDLADQCRLGAPPPAAQEAATLSDAAVYLCVLDELARRTHRE